MERARSLKTSSVGRSWGTSARLVCDSAGWVVKYEACIITWQMGLLHMPTIGLHWGYFGTIVCIIPTLCSYDKQYDHVMYKS